MGGLEVLELPGSSMGGVEGAGSFGIVIGIETDGSGACEVGDVTDACEAISTTTGCTGNGDIAGIVACIGLVVRGSAGADRS